jgi:exosome complex component RRP40
MELRTRGEWRADGRLMSPKFPLLPTLAAHIAFEICIGLNGKIWFKSTTISEGIALKRILEGVDSGELEMEKGAVERALREYMA